MKVVNEKGKEIRETPTLRGIFLRLIALSKRTPAQVLRRHIRRKRRQVAVLKVCSVLQPGRDGHIAFGT